MKFEAATGSRIGKDKIKIYGKIIYALTQKYERVTPELVVETAKNPKSPLHDYFDWNDKTAAEKFRLEQARLLLRSIIIVDHKNIEGKVRAFYNVSEPTEEGRTYVTLDRVLSEPDLREQVIEYAYAELEGWKERYKQYSEFRTIFKAIEEFKGGKK
jgi:hypothetical protein